MSKIEDTAPHAYAYAWSKDSDITLPDFLTKYKPSMVQDDGTKPWIFVKGSAPSKEDKEIDATIEEASHLLKEITEKVEQIKNDASIPTRSNKKTGAKSKKELREQEQASATEKLKDISVKHGFISGKWLIFAQGDKVDMIWSSLANSLVSGPLASTCAYMAKVATCPRDETPNYQHVMCLYMPDVYDKEAVTEVMRVLLKDHGMNLTGVKSNLYTALGIDSKHASGLQSTIWKNTALLKDTEIKELKDAYFSGLSASKPSATEKAASNKAASNKQKLKPKKKVAEDDPFASEDEDKEAEEETTRKEELKTKKNAQKTKRAKDDSDEDDAEEEEERPKAKKRKGKDQ